MRYALAMCLLAAPASGQHCASTPEAAAHAVIGSGSYSLYSGYRVADVQIDPVMARVWFRVVHCDGGTAPAVLVPVDAPLQNAGTVRYLASPAPLPPVVAPILIHAGETTRAVYETPTLRMTVDATANQPGGVGDVISLTLKRRDGQAADEPYHRIRGTVRADKTVEVMP